MTATQKMNYQSYKVLKQTLKDILASDKITGKTTDTKGLESLLTQAKNTLKYSYNVEKKVENYLEETGHLDDDLLLLMEVAHDKKEPQQRQTYFRGRGRGTNYSNFRGGRGTFRGGYNRGGRGGYQGYNRYTPQAPQEKETPKWIGFRVHN